MRLFLAFLTLSLTFPALAAKTIEKYELKCQVELNNGKTPKILMQKMEGHDLTALKVHLTFGPYSFWGKTEMSGRSHFTTRPTLVMNVFKGHPVQGGIYNASASGFEQSLTSEVLEVSGYQFMKVSHEKIDYTRADYLCTLRTLKK